MCGAGVEWGGVEWSEVKWSGVACTVIIYGSNLLAMRGGIMANCDCTVLGPSLILAGLRLCLSSGRCCGSLERERGRGGDKLVHRSLGGRESVLLRLQ